MKPVFLFATALFFSSLTHGQTVTKPAHLNTDSLKVSLNREVMTVRYKNQPVPVHTIQELDSFLKKIPNQQHLEIYFETVNTSSETSRVVNGILRKCNCHIARNSRTYQE